MSVWSERTFSPKSSADAEQIGSLTDPKHVETRHRSAAAARAPVVSKYGVRQKVGSRTRTEQNTYTAALNRELETWTTLGRCGALDVQPDCQRKGQASRGAGM